MKFVFDQNKFYHFLSKWEQSKYVLALILFLGACAYSIPSSLANNLKGVLFMFIVFCYFFSILVVKWFILEARSINRFISVIEFENSTINLATASFSTLFGVMRKKSINLEISEDDVQFELAKPKYPMNSKYLGTVYIIKVSGKEYYLLENLYDDFEKLEKYLKVAIAS